MGGAFREMSSVVRTSPKMTFFKFLPSRGGVLGTHGSCGVACDRGTCWKVQFGRCPQFLGHLPKWRFPGFCPQGGPSGGMAGHVESQVVGGFVGRYISGDVPNSWDISQNDVFRVFDLKGGRLGGGTGPMRSQVIGVHADSCNSGDVLNSWDISRNEVIRPSAL